MALRGRATAFGGEWVVRAARNAWRSLRACVWAAGMWQEGRGRARRCAGRAKTFGEECIGAGRGSGSARAGSEKILGQGVSLSGASEGLRRGMCREVGGECIAHPLCGAVFLCPKRNRGGERRSSAGNAWRSLRVCVGAAWGSGRAREGSEKMLGQGASLCGGGSRSSAGNGLCGRRGLTHFRRSRSRVRVLLYIRPPRHRCEIAAMGPKDAPCEHPSPAKTSAPAASAFIFPRRRSHFLRIPFGLPLNDVRPCRPVVHTSPAYPSAAPTKASASRSSSYPQWVIHGKVIHIVARRPVQNVLASRLRTRIYNISFARRPLPGSVRAAVGKSPRRCDPVSRVAERRVGKGEGKGGRRLAQQPAPARLRPRPCPLVCRITVRKGGSAQGNPPPYPCVLPAPACLRPCSRPLMGVALCVLPAPACLRPCTLPADGRSAERRVGRAKAKADAPSRSNPHFPRLRPSPCAQRRKCTRPTPPLPVRTPRVSPPTAEPLPAYGRITVRKGGSAQGNPRSCRAFFPRQPAYGRAPAR